ncbi:MAG: hypothetical protein KU38_01405 [Sulfurovum sp. FS08-3]|nr:MAG: hypothetical protein KU38_01405 [Sulfurovum sp. FS08-3]
MASLAIARAKTDDNFGEFSKKLDKLEKFVNNLFNKEDDTFWEELDRCSPTQNEVAEEFFTTLLGLTLLWLKYPTTLQTKM